MKTNPHFFKSTEKTEWFNNLLKQNIYCKDVYIIFTILIPTIPKNPFVIMFNLFYCALQFSEAAPFMELWGK